MNDWTLSEALIAGCLFIWSLVIGSWVYEKLADVRLRSQRRRR